jgi:hypothetical protein
VGVWARECGHCPACSSSVTAGGGGGFDAGDPKEKAAVICNRGRRWSAATLAERVCDGDGIGAIRA